MFQEIKYFVTNIWKFRRALYLYRSWNYEHIYEFEKTHLLLVKQALELDTHHPNESNLKRVNEALALLERMDNYPYLEMYLDLSQKVDANTIIKKPGVNHTKVNCEQQYKNDKERYYFLMNKYSGGFWT